MTEQQKEILQAQLNREKRTLKELEQVYKQALKDVEKKIAELSSRRDMENLQSIIYQKQYQEALKAQLEGVIANLQSGEYATISDYLQRCYEDGYLGVMYDLQAQGIPIIVPIDQAQVTQAIQTDTKLSKGLYARLGEDINKLKTSIRAEISRGIATGLMYNDIAEKIAKSFNNTPFSKAYNNAMRIARTEGHRIQVTAADHAQHKAKEKGANIVKQWDATLDSRTRDSHMRVDGEIRELDEPFSNGLMYPGDPSGDAAEVVNCRCALLQRAKSELGESELETLKKRAEYFGLDKTKNFDEFKDKYLNATSGLSAKVGGNGIPEHEEPKLLKTIQYSDKDSVMKEIIKFESNAVKESIEMACVITAYGEVYKCFGVEDRVFPDSDLKEKLYGATISHNHPVNETAFTFSTDDLELFMKYDLEVLRGCDELYTYELTRNAKDIDKQLIDWTTEENYQHCKMIENAKRYGIGYRRWKNE